MPVLPPYQVSNEYNVAEILQHYDINYVLDVISNKVNNINYASTLTEPNIIDVLMGSFKIMEENEPSDSDNIKQIREEVFLNITQYLCNVHKITFNEPDDINTLYTAARYLYDFLICNRVNYMVDFFVTYIVNNKDSIADTLNIEDYRKGKDSAATYAKRVYSDPKYGIIAANIPIILKMIGTLEITLYDLFMSAYKNPSLVSFLDNTFSENTGAFFSTFYIGPTMNKEIEPIIITNVTLALQKIIGDKNQQNLAQLLTL